MRNQPLVAVGALVLATLTVVGASAPAAHAAPGDIAYALSGTNLLRFDLATPGTVTTTAITGVNAGETLAGLDVRPMNGQLYTLGVNPGSGNATLYVVHEQTGVVGAVGAVGSVDLVAALPNPATTRYGLDFYPSVDVLRVTAGSINFRVRPSTGLLAGTDSTINGLTTNVDEIAYTNSLPDPMATTLYTIDSTTDSLYIQNPPNNGVQGSAVPVTVGGSTLDFTAAGGFDIAPGVNATTSNAPVPSGSGYAVLTAAGTTRLYLINLMSGAATVLGAIGSGAIPVSGLALQRDVDDGYPVVGLTSTGGVLARFSTKAPGSPSMVGVTGLSGGETLAAIAWRPLTGQLLGLGINPGADTGTLYNVDPQSAVASSIGASGSLSWVESDGVTAVDLPNPAFRAYAMDVNPQVDRIRITSGADFNARANPTNGQPVDGGGIGVSGTNPDGPTGTALSAVAYTNAYGGAATTSLYGLSAVPDQVVTINPPNNGTLVDAHPVSVDFGSLAGFDIPEDLPGTAYAALTVGGQPGVYTVDLSTGTASSLGSLTTAMRSLAVGSSGANRPVVTPPTTTPPTTTPPVEATPATVAKVGKAVQRKKVIDTGRALTCPTAFAAATCATKIKVTTSYRVKGKKKPKTVVIATKSVSTSKGGTTRLTVTLSKAGVKLLKQRKVLAAKVAISAPTGPGAATQTTTVAVRLAKKKL